MWKEGERERRREGGSIYLYLIFVLEKKTKRKRGDPDFIFLARKNSRSLCTSLCTRVSDTASTLLRHCFSTHTHTRHLYTTHTHILEISTWCCERNPLSSSSYPHLYLSTDRQTKPNQTDQTQHDTSTINPVTYHCTNLLSSDSKAAGTVT